MCIADLTLQYGTVASNDNLRGRPTGNTFPYIVIARGNPHKWHVQTPQGDILSTPYNTAEEAEEAAVFCKLTHKI